MEHQQHFAERPAVKAAYKDGAARSKLPFDAKEVPIAVPSCGQHHSAVSVAFDYMARFRVARDVMRSQVPGLDLWDGPWAADAAMTVMDTHPRYGRWYGRWAALVDRAHALFMDFVEGREDSMARAATCSQFMANLELLLRVGDFSPDFKARHEVQAELVALDAAFDPMAALAPRRVVVLNPTFPAADAVGGSDADLLVDGAIVDVKTSQDLAASAQVLRKLAWYAALHRIGGTALGDGTLWQEPVDSVAVYYSRYGVLARWPLDELFPAGGFDRFVDACRREIAEAAPEPAPAAAAGPR